ncbi:UNVERIFIED_CONTAM: hypothetical protein K2H54_003186 [Gekko kuhli]
MGSGLLWGLVAAFALAVLAGLGQGAELREATRETEGEPPNRDLRTLQPYSTTVPVRRPRNRTGSYRTGSLSVLSRTATEDLSVLLEEWKRNISRDPCLGCCGTPLPERPGGREDQPSEGDSGHPPTTAVPGRNSTTGDFRPGAYTPMRRMRTTGSFSGTAWTHPREDGPIPDRCQGCCGVNTTASANPPGRREEGKGSPSKPTLGGSPSKGSWRPVLDGKDPDQHSSQTEEDERPMKDRRGEEEKRVESAVGNERGFRECACTWLGIQGSCVAPTRCNEACADEFPFGLGPVQCGKWLPF